MLMVSVTPIPYEAEAQEKKRIQLNVKERKRKKSAKQAAPKLRRSAVFAMQVERKLIKGIDRTTRFLIKTAKSLPKKSQKRREIMERVLNLFMENATYVRNEEERRYDKAWVAWDSRGRKGREPKLSTKKSFTLWKKVIKHAAWIQRDYPRNKSADVVMFNRAVGLQYIGREKEAARVLSNLVERFKGSPIAGDAYASLGDYYFDRNDFRNARNNYKKATRFRRSKRYLWSIFKLGWCAYNLNEYRKAMASWKQVVSASRRFGAQGKQVREEALRDLVYAFAELKQVEGAIAYYRANGGSQFIGPFLTLLGQTLADQGQYKRAIGVYRKFQQVAPSDPEGPTAQKEIINLLYITGKLKQVWKELERLHRRYNARSSWASRNKKDLVKETTASIKDQIMYYSSLTHQKAIKDGNRRLNNAAKRGYLLFLRTYPKSKEVPGVKYLIADIEYFLKRYQSSGRYYFEIASLGKKKALRFNPVTNKFNNIHRESSIDMVRSYAKDFAPEFKILKKRKPNFKKPKPLSVRAKNYIKACGNYVKWYPKDRKKVKTCDMDIANIYFRSGHQKNAVKYLRGVAMKYPKGKEGTSAVKMVIPMLKDNKVALAGAIRDFLKVPRYRSGKIGNMLRGLQVGTELDNIMKEKNRLKKARALEKHAKKYPKNPEVDAVWYNAAVEYMKAGAISDAIRAHTVIVKRFPKKDQAKDSLLTIARVQESQLNFTSSSESYLLFNKRYPKSKEALVSLAKACELQVALNSGKALSTCSSLARREPSVAKVFVERMINAAFLSKSFSKMGQLITKVYLPTFNLSPNEKIVAWKRIYDSTGGKGPTANRARQTMISIFQSAGGSVDGEALRAIGDFSLAKAIPIVPRFLKVKLQGGTVENLITAVQQKGAALAQVEGAMQQVLSLKDAYSGSAAYTQLGIANEHFSDALANPPAIKGASKEDVVKELAPQIAAYKKSAQKFYGLAIKTASDFNVYSRWTIVARNGLARVANSKFNFDDYVVAPDFVGNEVPSNWVGSLRQ